jgi:hypothetical protein
MTVFGVWLGVRMDRARRQQQAVEVLRERGGVSYESSFMEGSLAPRFTKSPRYAPAWLRAVVGDDFFDRVRSVYLYESAMYESYEPTTDADLKCLANLPDVESLRIDSLEVSDAGIAHLKSVAGLKELVLFCPKVTDAGLTHIHSLKEIRHLIIGCSVTDHGILELERLKKLETLRIDVCGGLSPEGRRAVHNLDSPTRLEMTEVPLLAICDYLADYYQVAFPIDQEAAVVAGMYTDEILITAEIDKLPLDSALDVILRDTGLDWILTPDGILITTKDKAAKRLAAVRELKQRSPNLTKVICVVAP